MSIPARLTALKSAMDEFYSTVIDKAQRNRSKAQMGGNADTLDGMTPDQVRAKLMEPVQAHMDDTNNPHKLDGDRFGYYTAAQEQTLINSLLPVTSDVPFSFYGDTEYIPPGVYGSYESGTTTQRTNAGALLLEDNGTLVWLRNGTDGNTRGVYYSYLRNAPTSIDMAGMINTNTPYRPSIVPAGQKVAYLLPCTEEVIIGRLGGATDNSLGDWIVMLTNGTLDATKHVGCIVPANGFIQPYNHFPERDLYSNVPRGVIFNDQVLFVVDNQIPDNNHPLSFAMYTVPLTNLINGAWVNPVRITGWRRRVGEVMTVTDDLVLYNKRLSGNAADKAAITYSGVGVTRHRTGGNWPILYVKSSPDRKTISLATGIYTDVIYGNGVLTVTNAMICVEFSSAKTIDMTPYESDPAWVRTLDTSWQKGGRALSNFELADYYFWGGDNAWSWATSEKGDLFYVNHSIAGVEVNWLGRLIWPAGQAPNYAARLGYGVATTLGETRQRVWPRFGSPIGSCITAMFMPTDASLVAFSFGGSRSGFNDWMGSKCAILGSPNYLYSSYMGNQWYGYPPNSDRTRVDDLGLGIGVNEIYMPVIESDSSGQRIHQARYWMDGNSYYSAPGRRQGAANIDGNLNRTGSVALSNACFNDVRQQVINWVNANIPASEGVMINDPIGRVHIEVVVPQRFTDVPPIIYALVAYKNAFADVIAFRGDITSGNRANVQGMVLGKMYYRSRAFSTVISCIQQDIMAWVGPAVIHRWDTAYFLAISPVHRAFVTGNALNSLLSMKYYPDRDALEVQSVSGWNPQVSYLGYMSSPAQGVMFTYSDGVTYANWDDGTKLLYRSLGRDRTAEYDAIPNKQHDLIWNDKGSFKVMIAQKLVTGWTVYFSAATDCMVDGRYAQIPAMTYNLNSATDANKTFHVWAVWSGNGLAYSITTDTAKPSANCLYLGNFITDANGLKSVNVSKNIAVGGYLISPDDRGGAVPVTSGTPDAYGRLNWT